MPEIPTRPRPWLGTSWKMTKGRQEAEAYAKALTASAPGFVDALNAFVLPAYPLIEPVATLLVPAGVRVGAQNVHWAESGAFTGEVAASMVAEIGATMAAIGHAERRAMFGETDETVNARVKGALKGGLTPLICVGESSDERNAGLQDTFVTRQLEIAIAGLTPEEVTHILVAYEPVWAIGAGGTPASPNQANDIHAVLRRVLIERYGEVGEKVPLLYGGSVNVQDAPELISSPHIDGLFVGRAAWTVEGFTELAHIVAQR